MAIITREEKGSALSHDELDNNFIELKNNPDGATFPKDAGIGIKVDIDDPTFPWFDMEGTILADGTANRAPYIGGISQVQFVEGEDAYVSFHMPHDYVPNTDMYIHTHWSHNSTVVTGGTVTWVFETMYAKGHNQQAFKTPVNISVVDTVNTIQYQHQIAETIATSDGGSAVTLDINEMEVDGIIICRVYLDSNDLETSDGSTVNPFVHFADLHYQSNVVGTKNKAPDFYS